MATRQPIRVAVTGAAGNIGYALLPRIANGDMFGPEQPVQLQLLEITPAMSALEGVVMELDDCAFPLLVSTKISDDPAQAFDGAHYVLMVGARPRGKGMDRSDLLVANGPIFVEQGRALQRAHDGVRILVVGNPANTNALIAASHTPDIDIRQFGAMTRLDHNRAISLLAQHLEANPRDISGVTIWGNHSGTMVPDLAYAQVNGAPISHKLDTVWVQNWVETVRGRGSAVIRQRGASSAASAANAIIGAVLDWHNQNTANDWVSMAIASGGQYIGPDYNGLFFSYPIRYHATTGFPVVKSMNVSAETHQTMVASAKELQTEREIARANDFLGPRDS